MATERYDTIINVDYLGQGDVARYLADLQRLMRAAQQAEGMFDAGTRALPQAERPREAGRFVSRERDLERRQTEFLDALRERIAAERAATEATRRLARATAIALPSREPIALPSREAREAAEAALTRGGGPVQQLQVRAALVDRMVRELEVQSDLDRQITMAKRAELRRAAEAAAGGGGRQPPRIPPTAAGGAEFDDERMLSWIDAEDERIRAQQAREADKIYAAQANLRKARLDLDEVIRRVNLPEDEGGYTTREQFASAYDPAVRRVELANEALTQALTNRTRAEERARAAAEKAAAASQREDVLRRLHEQQAVAPDWVEQEQERIRQRAAGDYDDVTAAKAHLDRMANAYDEMIRRGDVPFRTADVETGLRGFRDADERSRAFAQGAERLDRANKRLERAIEARSRAEEAAAAAAQEVPQVRITPELEAELRRQAEESGVVPRRGALEQAQEEAARATRNVAEAQREVQRSLQATYSSRAEAERAYIGALEALSRAQQNETRASQRLAARKDVLANLTAQASSGGGGGGYYGGGGGGTPFFEGPGSGARGPWEQFGAGFRGRGDMPYMEQLGQTAKFSIFYGAMYNALFMLTATFQQTVQEGVEFQEAITNLSIAAGRPKEELDHLADQLSRSAVEAGAAPSQGVEIGARALGLYGVTQASADERDRVARISAQVVSRLALGSQKTPVELQGDIAAIAQALGMSATGQVRIADLDAFMTKWFGTQQGSTLETVAQSASVGRAAGFSDEELFGIAALMQSRTGQTSAAVAGFMAQIFSRGGEGSLVDVARRQGVDPNQELRTIIAELSRLYSGASAREQAEISAAFGRGKIQNAAVALLESFEELERASRAAARGATGSADQQFSQRIANIGGVLRQLGGEFSQFAQLLGEAGLLDVIGAGAVALTELLQAVNALLGMWNQLPDVTQQVIIALGLLAVALRTGAAQSALGALAARGGARVVPAGQGIGAATVIAGGQAQALRSAGGFATAARAAGAGLMGMLGPIGIAVTGLMAVGSLVESSKRIRDAQDAAADALAAQIDVSSPEDYRARASALRSAARTNEEATGWFHNLVTFGQANNEPEARARQLNAEARRMLAIADRLEQEAAGIAVPELPTFASFGEQDVAEGLESIANSGGTAADQLAALRDVIYGTADAAQAAAEAFSAAGFAQEHAANVLGSAVAGLAEFKATGESTYTGSRYGRPSYERTFRGADFQGALGDALTGREAARRLREGLRELDVESLGQLDATRSAELAGIVGEGLAEKILQGSGATPEVIAAFQEQINNSIRDYLLGYAHDATRVEDANTMLTPEEARVKASAFVTTAAADMDTLQASDVRGRVTRTQRLLRDLRQIQRRTDPGGDPENYSYLVQQIDNTRRALAESQFEEMENLRRAAMQNARNRREANAIGRQYLEREINAAVRAGNADVLVEIIGQAGAASRQVVRQAIEEARRVARAAIRQAQQVAEMTELLSIGVTAVSQWFGMEVPEQPAVPAGVRAGRRRLRELRRLEQAMASTPMADPDQDAYTWSGMDVYNPNKPDQGGTDRETALDRQAARAAARAARSGSGVAAARAQILAARAALEKAKAGSVDYYSALEQLYLAQHSLADAVGQVDVARAQAQATRRGGAIAAAHAQIVSARVALRAAGGDQAAYWAAMGELWAGQQALADAMAQHRTNLRLLSGDITNPLVEARIATREAADRLRRDLAANRAGDVIAQSRVDLRRAQANEEAVRFSQRLQSVQTAEELGRISHARYINYLENERRRLEAIKNRTYQQQDQLNQIDRLLQDAANQMEAQWNFGDIRLPTPYQVRRYIEERSGAREARMAGAARMTTVQNNTFQINGADTAKVRKIIEDTVGGAGRVRTAASRRR